MEEMAEKAMKELQEIELEAKTILDKVKEESDLNVKKAQDEAARIIYEKQLELDKKQDQNVKKIKGEIDERVEASLKDQMKKFEKLQKRSEAKAEEASDYVVDQVKSLIRGL